MPRLMMTYLPRGLFAVLTISALLGGCGELEPTRFIIENSTDGTVYVKNSPQWLQLIVDGEPVWTHSALCVPRCGVFGGGAACFEPNPDAVIVLEPGESHDIVWDGTYYDLNPAETCYREHKGGRELEAEYCGNDPACERQAFERGDQVVFTID